MASIESSPTVLIAGSTSGIGAATARALAEQGWHVVVSGRDQTRGAAVVVDIEEAGGQAAFVPSDLAAEPSELRQFADAVRVGRGRAPRGRGAIVVIGSWMAHVGSPIVVLYSASKAAEIELARSWAAEFGSRGVRVNTVSPGATSTPINASSDDVIAQLTAGIPVGRPGTPDEVAAAVAWLLSDAAGYLHGVELRVDGGISTTRLG